MLDAGRLDRKWLAAVRAHEETHAALGGPVDRTMLSLLQYIDTELNEQYPKVTMTVEIE